MRMRENTTQRRGVEPASTRGEEQRGLRPAHQVRPCFVEIAGECVRSLFAERDDALLAALPANVELLTVEIHVTEVEPDGLRGGEACRVDELDQRTVPYRERLIAVERHECRLDLRRLGRVRQTPGPPRRERGVGYLRGPEREPKKAPYRCELARDRGRRELSRPRPSQLGRVVREHFDVHVPKHETALLQPVTELFDVMAIGPACAFAESRREQEALDGGRCVHAKPFVAQLASPPYAATPRAPRAPGRQLRGQRARRSD